jgi:predicted phage-related endonuclease
MTARAATKGIVIRRDLTQGSEEWHAARIGLLTASELGLIVTPKLKIAANEKVRCHVYELLAQRVNGWTDDSFVSFAMARGWEDEVMARFIYSENVAPVEEVGFITNDEWGFTLGYSPDGLVGDDGLIECKSRMPKYQAEVIISHAVPDEHVIQVQAAMLISGRKWCDYVSYSGGMPMAIIRVEPDERIQDAIVEAAEAFEKTLSEKMDEYLSALETMKRKGRYFETERRKEEEITAS